MGSRTTPETPVTRPVNSSPAPRETASILEFGRCTTRCSRAASLKCPPRGGGTHVNRDAPMRLKAFSTCARAQKTLANGQTPRVAGPKLTLRPLRGHVRRLCQQRSDIRVPGSSVASSGRRDQMKGAPAPRSGRRRSRCARLCRRRQPDGARCSATGSPPSRLPKPPQAVLPLPLVPRLPTPV